MLKMYVLYVCVSVLIVFRMEKAHVDYVIAGRQPKEQNLGRFFEGLYCTIHNS